MAATTGLTSSFQSVSQALKDAFSGDRGDSEALFNAFKALVSLVAIGAIVATLFTGGANPGSGNGDGSSDSDGLPPYEYQQPDLETQDLLRDVMDDVFMASAAHRKIIEDPEYLYAATAATYADGQIYVVVQFDNAQTIRAATESARANNADGSS